MTVCRSALVWLLVLVHHASAFTPSTTALLGHGVDTVGRQDQVSRRTKVLPHRLNTLSADTDSSPATALEKLIERQKDELRQNERLLQILKQGPKQAKESYSSEDDEMSDMAASIISGFDYGFISRSEGATVQLASNGTTVTFSTSQPYKGPPANLVSLGMDQFRRNWNAIKGEYRDEDDRPDLTQRQIELRAKLQELTLNSTEIWEREYAYHGGKIEAPLIIKIPYLAVCFMLDVVFENRYVPSRFYLLETVARMPYFSYITMLHLYETLGFWRRSADMKRIHFAEELNEYQHLLIMESLGGDQPWWVRFVAQHASIIYYVVLLLLWAVSPSLSYKFSELLETHAVNTYGVFTDENEALLKELPPSQAAVEYYTSSHNDPFYAEFQTTALSTEKELRTPGKHMLSLYDVFTAIRDDEGDHVGTMQACLDPEATLRSASLEKRLVTAVALASVAAAIVLSSGAGPVAGPEDIGRVVSEIGETLSESTGLDVLVAGLGGLAQQVLQSNSEGNLLEVGNDLAEATDAAAAAGGARRGIVAVLEAIGAIFSRII
ncbi:hypothetical protein ACA910_019657 [Epithemia clementina (nom. ined.)]